MKTKCLLLITSVALTSAFSLQPSALVLAAPLGAAWTYQGQLTDGGVPASGHYDLEFTLYDDASGGTAVSGPITTNAVRVANGLFTAVLDFGAGAFTGGARWLGIGVRTNGGASFTPLSPRQPLTPAPYALYAPNAGSAVSLSGTLPAAQLSGTIRSANVSGTYANAVTFNNAANSFSGSGSGLTGLNASQLSTGTVPDAQVASNVARTNQVWLLGGNAGTTPGTQFLGTADNQPFEVKVNSARALRLEPTASGLPNIIEGASNNAVRPGASGATIGGGGDSEGHQIGADFGTIAGGRVHRVDGYGSTIGGGQANTIMSNCAYSTIAGGWLVTLDPHASYVAVGGGSHHGVQTNADYTTIGGGYNHTIGSNALYATIAGGAQNAVAPSVKAGFVAGGQSNRVAGNFGFAAGRRAKADHTGAFVWADGADADFSSTAPNQFLIRATGGVGIGKNSPGTALDVNGTVTATAFAGGGAGLTGIGTAALADSSVNTAKIADGAVGNADLANNAVTSAKIADGTIGAADVAANTFWGTAGNTGTTPATHYLGTADYQPLEIKLNGLRALRLEPYTMSPNIIGGAAANYVAGAVQGATIGGGGNSSNTNRVLGNYATVVGGASNTAANIASTAMGWGAYAAANYSVAMGYHPTASGVGAAAMGGYSIASGNYSTALGYHTTAGGLSATAMGNYSVANGNYSAALGYFCNTANDSSFAAGSNAKALHTGAFVWADSTPVDFASTAQNQFLIRASGGVGIGTASPTRRLQVTETASGSLTYPVKVSNEGMTAGTAAGLLFQVDSGGDRGKGALVYERKDTWNRGSFHFLQNTGI